MPQMSKTRVIQTMPSIRLEMGDGLAIYPLMPGDNGYTPKYEQSLREMMSLKQSKERGQKQSSMKN